MTTNIQKKCEEFTLTIEAWHKAGIPTSLGDLKDLAIELGTPIPHFDKNMTLVFNPKDFRG